MFFKKNTSKKLLWRAENTGPMRKLTIPFNKRPLERQLSNFYVTCMKYSCAQEEI